MVFGITIARLVYPEGVSSDEPGTLMKPLWGRKSILWSLPQGGAALALGFEMKPLRGKCSQAVLVPNTIAWVQGEGGAGKRGCISSAVLNSFTVCQRVLGGTRN